MTQPREVTVWMWACDTHGTQPVHYQVRGSWVRTCRECGERLYQTLKWMAPIKEPPADTYQGLKESGSR